MQATLNGKGWIELFVYVIESRGVLSVFLNQHSKYWVNSYINTFVLYYKKYCEPYTIARKIHDSICLTYIHLTYVVAINNQWDSTNFPKADVMGVFIKG